ncbi:MAG: helix-turn-helix domain-containing protein [Pseudobdellovibrionaceae bacterium]
MDSKFIDGLSTHRESSFFENLWLDTNEAAVYLRTTPKQIRNWVYQGKIKAYRLLSRSYRFRRADLDSLLKGVL